MENQHIEQDFCVNITHLEYQRLIDRQQFDDTMRNQLLTFSFTTVMAVLGVAVGIEKLPGMSSFLCLIPYLLIIPFEARISYYRLESAHISSFLKVFASNHNRFAIGTGTVPEGKCKFYGLMAWLVNNEMVLLGIATAIVFYIRYIPSLSLTGASGVQVFEQIIVLLFPIAFETVIVLLTLATLHYGELEKSFKDDWIRYRNEIGEFNHLSTNDTRE